MPSPDPSGDKIDFEDINPIETGTISPTQLLKPNALLKENNGWDCLREPTTQSFNHHRRTSVGDLQHLRNDLDAFSTHQLQHSQRRNSYQVGGTNSMPFLFRSLSPPTQPLHPSPFLRHGSNMSTSHDLTLTQQQQHQPPSHINFPPNRQYYQLQHSHSLPTTPSPVPLAWPESTNSNHFPTLAPPTEQYLEERMTGPFPDHSTVTAIDHVTPPSGAFDNLEQQSCSSSSFSSLATPATYPPSLSLTQYNFDLRPMTFLNDSLDRANIENQDRGLSNHSPPLQSLFSSLRPPPQDSFPIRPSSANATLHRRASASLQIDPCLIPDHLSSPDHRFGHSKSACDSTRRASMVEDLLFSNILNRDFVNSPLMANPNSLTPLPATTSSQSRKPSLVESLVEEQNSSIEHLNPPDSTQNPTPGAFLSAPQQSSISQRASSLPPPAIPDSMRYIQLSSPGDSINLGPLTSSYIHSDTNSLFEEAFSALAGPLHSSLNATLGDIPIDFSSETHDKRDPSSTSTGPHQSPTLAKDDETHAFMGPTARFTLPPFSAISSFPLNLESSKDYMSQTRSTTDESANNQLHTPVSESSQEEEGLKPDGPSHMSTSIAVAASIPTKRGSGVPFQCTAENCTKSFGRRSDLARHTRIHTGERPYPCEYAGCGKRFIQRSALTVHMRTHSGEKPHSCIHPGCGKSFADSSSLARHRRTHNNHKLFLCNVGNCDKRFTRRTALVKHLKAHEQQIGLGIGNPDHVEQHSTVLDLATGSPPSAAMYNPTHNFLPPIHIREKSHLNPILPRSPRHISSSYVNSPLSTTMTLPPDHHHQYSNQSVVHRGTNHFVPPLNHQQRSQFVLPPINSSLYPNYRYPSSLSEQIPSSSSYIDHSIQSSPTSNSNPIPNPSTSTSNPNTSVPFPSRPVFGKIEDNPFPSDHRVLVDQCLNVKREFTNQVNHHHPHHHHHHHSENSRENWKVYHSNNHDENLRPSSIGF